MTAKELREKFAAKGLATAVIDLPDIGEVLVRELTLGDEDLWGDDDPKRRQAKILALVIYTPDGKTRVFDPEDDADVAMLLGLSRAMVNRITSALASKN